MNTFFAKIKTKIKDYVHLLFRSTADNHIRIQRCHEDSEGRIKCDFSFDSYIKLKKFQRRIRGAVFGLSSFVFVVVAFILFNQTLFWPQITLGSDYSWTQTLWNTESSGSEITHPDSGTTYDSKDSIDASAEIQLSEVGGAEIQTDNTTFDLGYYGTNTEMATTNDKIQLKEVGTADLLQTDDSQTTPSPSNLTGGWDNREVSPYEGDGMSNTVRRAESVVTAFDSVEGTIAAGGAHTCAINTDGGVECWGDNTYGQLGDGTTTTSYTPVSVDGLTSGYIAVVNGLFYSCAINTDGGVKCWGRNEYSQLGDGTTTTRLTPVQVSGLTSGATDLSAGDSHTCAVVNGAAKCWGRNLYGKIGDGTGITRDIPTQVVGLDSGVVAVAAERYSTCAVANGGAKCWGYNGSGQLGDGSQVDSTTPVQVDGLTSGVTDISTGYGSACAIHSGAAKCWGGNYYGELGNGTTRNSSFVPVQVIGLDSGVTDITEGYSHTCAVQNGAAKCWGRNNYGQLGASGAAQSNPTPLQVDGLTSGISIINAGNNHTCAIDSEGLAKCWGYNDSGRVGDGTIASRYAPAYVFQNSVLETEYNENAGALKTGYTHTCATDNVLGIVKCWGENTYGQLGDGTTTNSFNPVQVSGLTYGITDVATGAYSSCAINSGGGLKCWGSNESGQLGDGTTTNSSVPVQVTGLESGVTAVGIGFNHACAVQNGALKCWGGDQYGQLGSEGGGFYVPTQVTGLESGVTAVGVNATHACAVQNGALKCWGRNNYGQLGDGTLINKDTPTPVIGMDSGVTVVEAGVYSACGVQSGGVKCWGDNGHGQLGDGTYDDSSTPVQAIGLTGIVDIGVGLYHAFSVDDAGVVNAWGFNNYGQLGTEGALNNETPFVVSMIGSGVISVDTGAFHTCAVDADRNAKCWGRNHVGQLGYELVASISSPVEVSTLTRDTYLPALASHASSGTYTSYVDASDTLETWDTFSWSENIGAVGEDDITFKLKTSSSSTTPPDFTGCADLTDPSSPVDLTGYTGGCISNSERYLWYQSSFSDSGGSYTTAQLDDLTVSVSITGGYVESGEYTSKGFGAITDFGQKISSWGNLIYNETGTGTISIKVRSDADGVFVGATDWGYCGTIASGESLTSASPNCVNNSDQYIQYQVSFSGDGVNTPYLDDVSLGYNSYSVSDQKLISSAYDTSDSFSALDKITWTESGSGEIKFQMRTAPDTVLGNPDWSNGSGWCGPTSCAATTGDSDFADTYYTDSTGGTLANDSQRNISGEQKWIQYATFLSSSDGTLTPIVEDITVDFAFNNPPTIANVSSAQNSSGDLDIDYDINETDTEETEAYVSLFYQPKSDITLASGSAVDSADGTTDIVINNPSNVPIPASGSMLIDRERINYSSQLGNATLSGISRGVSFSSGYATDGSTHDADTAVYFKATEVTGDGEITGLTSTAQAKSMVWDPRTEGVLSGNNLTDLTIKVAANDGTTYDNRVGSDTEGSVLLDLEPATITTISSDTVAGRYKENDVIDVDLTFSEAVTSTGDITITLETGDVDQDCIANAITNSTTATCNYTVLAGDNSADLNVSSISGTINDQYLNLITNFTPTSNLADEEAIVVDTTKPTFGTVTPASNTYVNADGDVTLTLSEELQSGSLVFTSTTEANGETIGAEHTYNLTGADLTTLTEQTLSVSGLVSGNTYNLAINGTDLVGNIADTINKTNIDYDTTAPVVEITSPSNDYYANNITTSSPISYTASDNMSTELSTGSIVFTRTGGTADASSPRTCTLTGTALDMGSHNNVDLSSVCSGGLSLSDGTIYSIDFSGTDQATNEGNATQVTGFTYDVTSPVIQSFTSTTPDPATAYGTDTEINITANFNEGLIAGTSMTVRLDNTAVPSTDVVLDQVSGSSVYGTYTVEGPNLGHDTSDLTIASILSAPTDLAGNTATTDLPASNLADNSELAIDTGPPVLESFSATAGEFKESEDITITANYSESIQAGGSIVVKLNTDNGSERDQEITLNTVSAGTIYGTYTVGAGHSAETLEVTSIVSQSATDSLNNTLSDTVMPVTNISGTQVDNTDPVAVSVVVNSGDTLTNDQVNNLTLSATDNFDISDGTMQFSSDGTTWCASDGTVGGSTAYSTSSTFDITNSSCGGSSTNEVKTVYARFIDAAGNVSLSVNDTIEYDSLYPEIQTITTTTVDGVYGPTTIIPITVTYDESLAAGSEIVVTLDNGVDVTLDTVDDTTLSGNYTIGSTGNGEDSSDLTVGSISSQSATDLADNTQTGTSLAGISSNLGDSKTIIVDTTAPVGTVTIDRTQSSGQITISATDANNTGMQMKVQTLDDYTDDCSFTGDWEDYDTGESFTDDSDVAKKVCATFKDQVGNEPSSDSFAITPETPEDFQYNDISNFRLEPPFGGSFVSWQIPSVEGSGSFEQTELYSCNVPSDESNCTPSTSVVNIATKTNNNYIHENLESETKYCYKIRFKDGNSNYSKYSDTRCRIAGDGTPVTDSDVSIPNDTGDIEISDIGKTSATIKFRTEDAQYDNDPLATVAEVTLYSDSNLQTQVGDAFTDSDSNYNVNHVVDMTGLSSGETYYMKIVATDYSDEDNPNRTETLSYNETTNDNLTFTTSGQLTAISNISDPPSVLTDEKAVITFTTNTDANCSIEYGTASGDYTELPVTETSTEYAKTHSMHLVELVYETEYFYQITCQDDIGTTVSSDEDSFTTDEAGDGDEDGSGTVTDGTGPEISDVSVSEITGESAVVSWETDESADGLVAYGLVTGDYTIVAGSYDASYDVDEYATSHEIKLSNLVPATEYYFVAISRDESNNITKSSQVNFNTKEPSDLSSIKIVSENLNEATITWKTSVETSSIVEYGLTDTYGEVEEKTTKTKEHKIVVNELSSGETYHFRVKGKDEDGNLYSSSDHTFEPKSPPEISAMKVEEITEHTAKITFKTDVPTDAIITYEDEDDPDNSGFQGKPELTSSHEVILKNLDPDTTYKTTISARDELGSEMKQDFQKFTTDKDDNPPKIDNIRTGTALTQNDKVQAIISYTTDEPATTGMTWREGLKGKEKELIVDQGFTQKHTIVVTTFKSGTAYYFKAKSTDKAGNTQLAKDFAILTPKKKENIIQIIINNFQDIFSWTGNVGG